MLAIDSCIECEIAREQHHTGNAFQVQCLPNLGSSLDSEEHHRPRIKYNMGYITKHIKSTASSLKTDDEESLNLSYTELDN